MSWETAAAVTSTLVACTVLVGLVTTYWLVPFLQRKLIDPILTQLGQVVQIAQEAITQVRIIMKAWDHHQDWSQTEVDRIWAELRSGERVPRQTRQRD